jgi:hypothetical protein
VSGAERRTVGLEPRDGIEPSAIRLQGERSTN